MLGEPRFKTEVIRQIQSDAATNAAFLTLPQQAQEAFLDFCMGNRGLKVTYDPFFLHIFDPASHPDRLNRLLSCILGQDVTVKEVLPKERRRISEDGSLIIMDILAQLSDLFSLSFLWRKVLLFSITILTNTYTVHSLALIPD